MNDPYLIWSNEHRAWWRPGSAGYTTHLSAAGRYSREAALDICRDARGGWRDGTPPPEMPIREADAIECERSDLCGRCGRADTSRIHQAGCAQL